MSPHSCPAPATHHLKWRGLTPDERATAITELHEFAASPHRHTARRLHAHVGPADAEQPDLNDAHSNPCQAHARTQRRLHARAAQGKHRRRSDRDAPPPPPPFGLALLGSGCREQTSGLPGLTPAAATRVPARSPWAGRGRRMHLGYLRAVAQRSGPTDRVSGPASASSRPADTCYL